MPRTRTLLLSLVALALLGGGAWSWFSRSRAPRYVVQSGDTLWAIARDHGVTVSQLKAWNHLINDRIEVGQVLFTGQGVPSDPTPERHARRRPQAPHTAALSAPDSLSLPPAKPCLAAPSMESMQAGSDEASYLASAGLDEAQVRRAMKAFTPRLFTCVANGDTPNGTLDLHILVGCDGRVMRVTVDDDGGLGPRLAGCVSDTLRFAEFPAHDLPDGFEFRYPMVFHW